MLSSSSMVLNTGSPIAANPALLKRFASAVISFSSIGISASRPPRTFTTKRMVQAAGVRAASRSAPAGPIPSLIEQYPTMPGRQVSPWLRIGEALPARAPRCLEAMARSFG